MMRMKILLILFISMFQISSALGQLKWAISAIPDSLIKNADAVVRYNQVAYERTAVGKYKESHKVVISVLNRDGRGHANLNVYYDRNSKVKFIKGNVYNSAGALVRKIKKKDLRDYSASSSYTLFSDNRRLFYKPFSNKQKFTVEYEFEVNHDEDVAYSTWLPQNGYGISVEKSLLTFDTSEAFDIKYKEINHLFESDSEILPNGLKHYSWQVSNLVSIPYFRWSPGYLDVLPAVLLSPLTMNFEGTTGEFSSWNNYGKWVTGLIENRDMLSEELIAKVKSLTDTISSKRDKVKAVYQYMQGRTRYVNVALGIGGFQPVKAQDVHEFGYGDCKGLSNYTRALLKAVGIKSFYTEIGNGRNQRLQFPSFASANQTNHIILCVPMPNDSIWLECTSQTKPFGYIGRGNSNRLALLIKPDGGELVRTPKYEAEDNKRTSHYNVVLDETMAASFSLTSDFENYTFDEVGGLLNCSAKDQKKELLEGLNVDGVTISEFSVSDNSANFPKASLKLGGQLGKYATKAGDQMFVRPNFFLWNYLPSRFKKNRTVDFWFDIGKVYSDTLDIALPASYKLYSFPDSINIKQAFAEFQLDYLKLDDNKVRIVRSVKLIDGIFDFNLNEDIRNFFSDIRKKEKEIIVLVKK